MPREHDSVSVLKGAKARMEKGTPPGEALAQARGGTHIPPELASYRDDIAQIRAHIGKRIAFNAGRNRLEGIIEHFDEYYNLTVRVDKGREKGVHRLRLGRLSSYALLDDE